MNTTAIHLEQCKETIGVRKAFILSSNPCKCTELQINSFCEYKIYEKRRGTRGSWHRKEKYIANISVKTFVQKRIKCWGFFFFPGNRTEQCQNSDNKWHRSVPSTHRLTEYPITLTLIDRIKTIFFFLYTQKPRGKKKKKKGITPMFEHF